MTYTDDTIRDINGDHLKDFVVNWYASTGCCLKAFSDVYLLKPDNSTFSENVQFINPTFAPEEHVVRGLCYGHPGETEMYKFRWNEQKVDTLEYVAYERNNKGEKTGKFIITNKQSHYSFGYQVLKRSDKVPKEYRRIEGYDWFIGFDDKK